MLFKKERVLFYDFAIITIVRGDRSFIEISLKDVNPTRFYYER